MSSTAYGVFYYSYIPQINLERVLYLQYDASGQHHYPHATVALDNAALISQQAYDVELILDLPRTQTNLDAGNFMLDLSLLAPKSMPDVVSNWVGNTTLQDVLHRSRRPAILPYTSPVLSLAHTLVHLPWHLLNIRDLDRSRLAVPMFEMLAFARGTRNIPTHARLEIQSTKILQVYDAMLVFRAKFQGTRYLVYNYRVVSFLLFTMLFYAISFSSLVLGWAFFSRQFASLEDPLGGKKLIKQEADGKGRIKDEREQGKIKAEDETDSQGGLSLSNVSDTPVQYPTGRGRPTLAYLGRRDAPETRQAAGDGLRRGEAADDEDEGDLVEEEDQEEEQVRGRAFDSGIGTSMESEQTGTSGVRRRKSSRTLGR